MRSAPRLDALTSSAAGSGNGSSHHPPSPTSGGGRPGSIRFSAPPSEGRRAWTPRHGYPQAGPPRAGTLPGAPRPGRRSGRGKSRPQVPALPEPGPAGGLAQLDEVRRPTRSRLPGQSPIFTRPHWPPAAHAARFGGHARLGRLGVKGREATPAGRLPLTPRRAVLGGRVDNCASEASFRFRAFPSPLPALRGWSPPPSPSRPAQVKRAVRQSLWCAHCLDAL